MVSSYLRMSWKVANYNTLRDQVNTLRKQYHLLERANTEKDEQLTEFDYTLIPLRPKTQIRYH